MTNFGYNNLWKRAMGNVGYTDKDSMQILKFIEIHPLETFVRKQSEQCHVLV